MWRVNGNPNPCNNLAEILHTHPHLSKEGFLGGWPENFENFLQIKQKMFSRLQINLGSARYISQLYIQMARQMYVSLPVGM